MKIKKLHKKISENNLYSKAKIFRKNFLQKSRNDSVAAGRGKGDAPNTIIQQNDTSTKRTFRSYIGRFVVYKCARNNWKRRFCRFCAPCFFLFVMMDICGAAKIRAKKVPFARGAAARFIYPLCAFFVFRLYVWHLSFFVPLSFSLSSLAFLSFRFSYLCFCSSSLFVAFFGICLFSAFVLLFPFLLSCFFCFLSCSLFVVR